MPKNTKKLNIGFVLDDGLDKPDGVQQYVLELGQWFSKKGHNVSYLVGQTSREDLKGVVSMSRNFKTRFNANKGSTPLPASKTKIRQVLEEGKFDVLHVQMPYSPFMAGRVVKLAGLNTTIVGTFHVLPFGFIHSLATNLLGLVLKRNLKLFDAFFSVSPPASKFARRAFGIESEVVPNPVDIKKFSGGSPSRSKKINITFLGRLVKRKGCRELLEAVAYAKSNNLTNLDFEINICGTGADRESLENFARQNNIEKIVKFHGFIDESKKPEFLSRADIAVFPSLGGESFGIVLTEAMAAGAGVVIGGDNPGYKSVLEPFPETLFNPKDKVNFAKVLANFMENKKARAKIGQEQKEYVKKFDINEVAQQLLEHYLVAKKKHTSDNKE